MRKHISERVILIVLLFLSLLFFSCYGLAEKKATELQVIFFDVGQGDSTLINTPGGKHILIDGGIGEGSFGKGDQGKETLLPYLRRNGINHLDTVIMTHPDYDHIGGLVSIIQAKDIQINEFLDPGVAHPSRGYLDLLKGVQARCKMEYRQPRSGDFFDWEEGIRVEVLSPPYLLKDNNESSIVIKLTYGDISFLFTGDAAGIAENLMVDKYGYSLQSTILKAGHHGSSHSSTMEFLKKVRPEVAIFSCGENNKYGHPNEETIERLKKLGVRMFRTDQQGTITIITDGQDYQVKTDR